MKVLGHAAAELILRYISAVAVGVAYLFVDLRLYELVGFNPDLSHIGFAPLLAILMVYEVPAWMLLVKLAKLKWDGVSVELILAAMVSMIAVFVFVGSIYVGSNAEDSYMLSSNNLVVWAVSGAINIVLALCTALLYLFIRKLLSRLLLTISK